MSVYGDLEQWAFVLLVFLAGIIFVWYALHYRDENIRMMREYDPCTPRGNVTEPLVLVNNPYCSFLYAQRQNASYMGLLG